MIFSNKTPAMNQGEIENYWNTLCSFTGENPQEEAQILSDKILYPNYLFRYRSVNNNNLEALRTNKIYLSQASKYDDPFDTYLHIDFNRISQEFEKSYKSIQQIENLSSALKKIFSYSNLEIPSTYTDLMTSSLNLKESHKNELKNQFLSYIFPFRTKIQEKVFSACFSENGFNETLWLKYADMHKGFALMYDLTNEESFICGKKKECENCPIKQKGVSIYPVYYTNKPYDATEFAKTIMAEEIANVFKIPLEKIMINGFKSPIWEVEKNSLIKKECHKYDQEWRMIANCPITPPVTVEWIPDSVILGLRTSAVDAKLIISMAKQAGIKNVYQSYIDNSNRLNAFKISEEYLCEIIGMKTK